MLQNPATKSPFTVVPGYSRLYRRGAIYYFRVWVPEKLREIIGKKEIIKSLRTTELREAKSLCDLESVSANARFDSARRTLNPVEHPPTNPDAPVVSVLTLELWANPTRLVRYQDTGVGGYFPPRRDFANCHGARMTRSTPPDWVYSGWRLFAVARQDERVD